MGSVAVEISLTVLKHRIVEVMRDNYASDLSQITSDMDSEFGTSWSSNLHLPAPSSDAYFMVMQDPDEIDVNHNVMAFVQEAAERRNQGSMSGGGGVGEFQKRAAPVDVVVTCRRATYDETNSPVNRIDGSSMTHDEVLKLRSEMYLGAMIRSISENVVDKTSGIYDRELLDDSPGFLFDEDREKPVFGVAAAKFRINQKVSFPFQRSG